MNYALVENGIVTNIIWLNPGNASEFSNAFPFGELSVEVGDSFDGVMFYRNGERLKSRSEILESILGQITEGINDV